MISTRLMSAEGMPLMSVTMSALIGVGRWPSTSTRLLFGPAPRSDTEEIPTEFTAEICTSPCVVVGDAAGLNSGSWFR